MVKRMMLRCGVEHSDTSGLLLVSSKLYDGTPFQIKVTPINLELNEPLAEEGRKVDGWLYVEQLGKQGDRVSVSLPAATITHGHNVTVKVFDLLPPGVSLKDYGPK